jgi:acetolactate synthase-1/2/3 large subunit
MADGFARASNRVGVVTAQNGPAATLLVPPLSEAKAVSIPLVALVQDVTRLGRDRHGFQELDHFALFAGCSKWIRRLDDPARADDYLDMAFTAATTGRPGPAVLMLPKDLLRETSQSAAHARSSHLGTFPLDRPRPSAEAVRRAADLLAGAQRPVIIAGGGVHGSGASHVLAELQELAHIPVATTIMGKGSVSEDHPLSLGVMGYAAGGTNAPSQYLMSFIEKADVILFIGSRTNENATDSWRLYPTDATYIHLDVDGAEIGRNYEALRLVGDARAGLEDLRDCLKSLDLSLRADRRSTIIQDIAAGREKARPNLTRLGSSDASPMRPERVMAELERHISPDTIMVADASYSSVWMANYIRATKVGQRFLAPRGLAGLGWGLPMALGAKVAHPNRPVVCIAGDGGFAHVWAELETAVRSKLPVTIILLNNGILGYQKHAELYQFSTYTSAINFAPVDHAAIARSCGAGGVRIENPDDLGPAIQAALKSPVATLIEVMTSSDAYPPIRAWEGHEATLLTDIEN